MSDTLKLFENMQSNLNEDSNVTLEDIIEAVRNSEDIDLHSIVQDINSYDGSLEDLAYWPNDEEFFNTFYDGDIMGAVRAVCYGEYNFTDEYVKINAYGNLDTTDYIQGELMDSIEDIVDAMVRLKDEAGLSLPEDISKMIDEYNNGGEEE